MTEKKSWRTKLNQGCGEDGFRSFKLLIAHKMSQITSKQIKSVNQNKNDRKLKDLSDQIHNNGEIKKFRRES